MGAVEQVIRDYRDFKMKIIYYILYEPPLRRNSVSMISEEVNLLAVQK